MKKIKIAIDVSPLKDANRFRGVGFYTKNLVDALQRLIKEDKKYSNWQINLIDEQYSNLTIQQFSLIHYPYFDPFFLTLPKRGNIPITVTVHDLIPLKFSGHYPPGIKGKLHWFAQKSRLKKIDAIITDSQSSKKDIIEIVGYPENKIHVVYLASTSDFKVIKSTTILRSIVVKYMLPKKFVLYVGDVNWNKNVPGLVKACEKIGVPLVVVGKQAASKDYDKAHTENRDLVWLQNYFENCKSRLQRFGRSDCGQVKIENSRFLNLVGFVPTKDLVAIYNLAAVYCQPSFYEGFGLPVLEAMACGCPVVSSNRGSLPEICGKAALLVDSQQKSIARSLEKVINDRQFAVGLSKKGIEQAKKFSWRKTAENTIKVYQTILK